MYKPIIALAFFVCLCSISVAWEENTNRLGSDISANPIVLPAADPKLCAQECDNNPQCKSWAMDPNGAGPVCCWLKNAVVPPTPWTGVTSGVRGEGTQGPGTIDLTGAWKCNDGGMYYVRQIGNDIQWEGRGTFSSNGVKWVNVFHGTLSSGVIQGDWADTPEGGVLGSGSMVLQVESNNHFYATSYSGSSFGGSDWQRVS